MYENTKWLDRVIDENTGAIVQKGTGLRAEAMNKIEDGISDAHIFSKLMAIFNMNNLNTLNNGGLPSVTAADEGKFLRVVGGVWAKALIPNAEEASF